MQKLLLLLVLFTTAAHAQEFDLRTLPSDYSFEAFEPDAHISLRLLKREGDIWFFEETVEEPNGTSFIAELQVNRASQTVFWKNGGQERRYSPHDCGPSLGECTYKWIDTDDTFEMRSETTMVGDIWVSNTYFLDQGEWLFWSRDCTIYDEYGFWIDFVRLYEGGDSTEGARKQTTPDRLDELWRLCAPPDFIS